MQAVRRIPSMWRSGINSTRNYGKGGHHKMTTLNDMPVPEGDFFALHAARQKKYNSILAFGICNVAFGIFLMNATGFKLHYSPPKSID